MLGYMFQAALYCKSCGEVIRRRLIEEALDQAPLKYCQFCGESSRADASACESCGHASFWYDNYGFDSSEFPKSENVSGEADTVQHCDAGEDCLECIVLPDGRKIGAWLENHLTEDGMTALAADIKRDREHPVDERNPVLALHAEWYSEELAGLLEEEEEEEEEESDDDTTG